MYADASFNTYPDNAKSFFRLHYYEGQLIDNLMVLKTTVLCIPVNGLQALYSSYLTQMLFTVEMKGKREGGCHLMLFVFAHGPLIVEARWVTAAKAR
jgi:hypothetical protein